LQFPLSHLFIGIYSISLSIPQFTFNKDYPNNPQSFGEKIKKARMDAGLQIKELASIVGVTEDIIINWEKRGIMPSSKNLKEVKKFIGLSHY
jgi:ribosome-binding protein aMBF1 (putative translation factor)